MATRPRIIDADGHIMERQEDIRQYLPAPWDRRQTPLFPGDQPWDTDLFDLLPPYNRTPGAVYRRGLSPAEQVDVWHRIMDAEGIEQAVLFPTGSGGVHRIQERDFQLAVARACNDHFAKEYNARSDRLFCVGVLPLRHPKEAAEELRRAVTELGLVSFELLPTGLPHALGDPFYDPIYAEAERLNVALSVHGTRSWTHSVGGDILNTFSEVHAYTFPAGILLQFTSIICQGVPVRFPKLRLAFLEIGATWIPYYLDRLDEHWEKRRSHEIPLLDRPPSQLVREAPIYFSVEAGESQLPAAIEYLGADHYLYASDIPHWDNEFPESLERLWAHPALSAEAKQKILCDNARQLFRLPTPAGAPA